MNYFLDVIKTKYAQFNGRARRAEFWQFLLFGFVLGPLVLSLVIGLLAAVLSMPLLNTITVLYYFALIIPYVALGVRRMHDVDKEWYFLFVPFYSFILFLTEGTKGPNQFGPDPKDANALATNTFGTPPTSY